MNKNNYKSLNKKNIEKCFQRFFDEEPNPIGELDYTSDFMLLIAVVLSAQSTDKSVNIATKKLFSVSDTPNKIIGLGEKKLQSYIRNLGLFRTKATNIIRLCKILVENFDGKVPQNMKDLVSLPGVGRKTANVILNLVYKIPTIAVDTHVYRLSNRIGLALGDNVLEVEEKLIKRIPKKYMLLAHNWLILHGRYICKARKPECQNCIIEDICANKSYVKDLSM